MNKGQTFSWQKKSYSTYWNSPVDFSIQDLLANVSLLFAGIVAKLSQPQGTEEEEKEGLLCPHPLSQFLMARCCEYETIFASFFFSKASKNVESATGQPVESESEAAA